MDLAAEARPIWKPDPAWADPLLALLAAAALLLASLVLVRRQLPPRPVQVGLQGRLAELAFAASRALPSLPPSLLQGLDRANANDRALDPWDAALVALLRADRDRSAGPPPRLPSNLPGPAGPAFGRCWQAAFEGAPLPSAEERVRVRGALGGGWASAVLEARLEQRRGGSGEPLLQAAQARALRKLSLLAAVGFLVTAGGLAGAALGIVLTVARPRFPATLPAPPLLDGRGLALVAMAWFLGLLLSGAIVGSLLTTLPALAPFALPLAYGLHGSWGLFLLCKAQGLRPRALWARLTPGRTGPALLWGAGFVLLAIPLVVILGAVLAPLLKQLPRPQNELLQTLGSLRSPLALALAALTVAVAAPAFEELLFRGTLLPWMAHRWGWAWGLLASSLLFGAMHLQLGGLPTLSALGLVLGLAFRRGHSLVSAILGHGLWNGAVFLFLRILSS